MAIRVRVGGASSIASTTGVYAWGHHNIPVEGRWLAAVKACGLGAVLSHFAAAALWELVKWDWRPIDITAPTKHRHPRIHAHRSVNVERTVHKGIPVTPKLRTVIDLARVADERIVRRALRQARFSEAELAQLPRRIVDLGAAPTNSPLEDDVLDFVVRHGLARPSEVNAPYRLSTSTVYPDLRWPDLQIIVEVDGRQWHDDLLARRDDAARQAELEARGERVIRITRADMRHRPQQTIARLRRGRSAAESGDVECRGRRPLGALFGGALARVHPAHLLAAAAGGHRAPAAAAGGVEEDPAAVAARAAVQAGDAGRVGEQGDGVGGDGEADAPGLVVAPVEAEPAVLAADEGARGDGLGVGEAQAGERELVRFDLARERGEDVVQGRAQAARELELLGAAGPAGDAEPDAPAIERIRLEQRVGGDDLELFLGPVDAVGEVQRERAALEFDGFGGWGYHLTGEYTVR